MNYVSRMPDKEIKQWGDRKDNMGLGLHHKDATDITWLGWILRMRVNTQKA